MWDHTANLMAVLANCHRVKGKVFSARDFNPFYASDSGVVVLNREGAAAVMLAMGGRPANVEGS